MHNGEFIEIVKAIKISDLFASVTAYVKQHYKAKITDVGKITDPKRKLSYEAEVNGKELFLMNPEIL